MGQRRSIPGSRILITGASQGIGRALALAAARRGMKVLAAARSGPLLDELAREARADHNYVRIACHRMIPHALENEARGVCRGQRQFSAAGDCRNVLLRTFRPGSAACKQHLS